MLRTLLPVMFTIMISGCMTTGKVMQHKSGRSFELANTDSEFVTEAWLNPQERQLVFDYLIRNNHGEQQRRWCEVTFSDQWPGSELEPDEDRWRQVSVAERLLYSGQLPAEWQSDLPQDRTLPEEYIERSKIHRERKERVMSWVVPDSAIQTRTFPQPPERRPDSVSLSPRAFGRNSQVPLDAPHTVGYFPRGNKGGINYYTTEFAGRVGKRTVAVVNLPPPRRSIAEAPKYLLLPVTIPFDIVTFPIQAGIYAKEGE
jgi:hypothetical protein